MRDLGEDLVDSDMRLGLEAIKEQKDSKTLGQTGVKKRKRFLRL